MNKTIKPLVGIDKVKFGMTREQVMAVLGKPDEIAEDQQYGETPDDTTTVFYYDNGISCSFEKSEKYRLTEISFEDDEEYNIDGKIKLGMGMKEAISAAVELFGEEETEDDLTDDIEEGSLLRSFSFYEKNVSLWFDGDKKGEEVLVTIQIGPQWTEDENEIVWPK
ncbi:MAG: outer membrane protein assembly factor BamE [Marinilabiliaceae bacterium]|nr:outer membrane protein assembly factor BamE [Marinilabiliaceae bacterium]